MRGVFRARDEAAGFLRDHHPCLKRIQTGQFDRRNYYSYRTCGTHAYVPWPASASSDRC